jgi:3'-phosphoadenosine 5'-phosphosulfate sulfotransferase (PAPS reductase)/FAD synthetase
LREELFDCPHIAAPTLHKVKELSARRIEKFVAEVNPTHTVLMVSGGRDSAATAEVALDMGLKIDLILHGRTGTGIPQTTEFVKDYYGSLGPDFDIADAGTAYEAYVMRKGFFGIGVAAHSFAYHILKADPFRAAISRNIRKRKRGVRVMLLNGARKLESDNREQNLPETRKDGKRQNWWVNLIHDWSSADRDSYLALREVPINPVAIQLCRSGECMCGTMQSKQSRDEAAAVYPEWGCWLKDLRRRAREKHGWDWGEPMPKPADPRQFDMFPPMCVGCARDNQRDAA